jgi:hypothetical protein
MSFERPQNSRGGETTTDDRVLRPNECPDSGSKSIGTLAKIITVDTYWRCQACGAVWNETRSRTYAPRRRW